MIRSTGAFEGSSGLLDHSHAQSVIGLFKNDLRDSLAPNSSSTIKIVGLISIDRTIKEMAFSVKDEARDRVQNDG
jgi:hypothetical protein